MGLDWLAGNKARPGHEKRFREILEIIVAEDYLGPGLDEATREEWMRIGMPAYETVGAPRVGIDAAANEWLLQRIREDQPKPGLLRALVSRFQRGGAGALTPEEQAALRQSHGYYVLELAPPCDGLPWYSNAPLMGDKLELTSFRGAFLSDCEEMLGTELLESAWDRKLPEDLAAYGQTLRAKADAWAQAHGCEAMRDLLEPPPEAAEGSPESVAHIAYSAARWCIYWGERGHWLDVWF